MPGRVAGDGVAVRFVGGVFGGYERRGDYGYVDTGNEETHDG